MKKDENRDLKLEEVKNELKKQIDREVEREFQVIKDAAPDLEFSENEPNPLFGKVRALVPAIKKDWRPIIVISIVAYIAIIFLTFFCSFFTAFYCLSKGINGAGGLIILIAVVELMLLSIYSFLTAEPKEDLIFTAMINLPIILFVIYLAFAYIGFLILGLVILSAIVRFNRR